ncbi:MAG: hypothetical protein K6E73_11795 [Bacteroidales bacterium]|nr:hypothetical protein [Bacteroidales bacterium]
MKQLFLLIMFLMVSIASFAQTGTNDSEKTQTYRIKQVTDDFYVNLDYYDQYPSYERLVDKSNHLHGWGKFCLIYGYISAGVGGWALGTGISYGDGYCITMGSICAAEGIALACVGGSMMKKCKKTREEISRINSIGFPTSEIRIKDKILTPSVNLMSDTKTQEKALGLGLTLSF